MNTQMNRPFGTSLFFIYFIIGFVLSGTLTMVTLIIAKPWVPMISWVRLLAMISPLVVGISFGWRVASIGRAHQLPLSHALLKAIGVRG